MDALAVSASENRMGLFLLIDCINQDSVSGYYEIPNLAFGFRIIQGYIGGRQISQKVILQVYGICQSFSGFGFWQNGSDLGYYLGFLYRVA